MINYNDVMVKKFVDAFREGLDEEENALFTDEDIFKLLIGTDVIKKMGIAPTRKFSSIMLGGSDAG